MMNFSAEISAAMDATTDETKNELHKKAKSWSFSYGAGVAKNGDLPALRSDLIMALEDMGLDPEEMVRLYVQRLDGGLPVQSNVVQNASVMAWLITAALVMLLLED